MPSREMAAQQPAAADAVLRALLVSDLVGSTQLIGELGDTAAAELLQHHSRLARDLLAKHGGREVDKADGFFLLFERPFEAVLYALEYHQALRCLSEDLGRIVEARVGIHLGEVVLKENSPEDVARGAKPLEVEGLAKPIAARLTSLAKGRQTLLTRGCFDVARRSAVGSGGAENLRWLSHGSYRFAGVEDPVEVCEVGREGLAPLMPPADSEKARRTDEQPTITGWRPAPGVLIPHRPHWRVKKRLGEGGFGEVWLAIHEKTGDRRVFKFCYDAARLRTLQREITLFRLLKEELGEREDITRILDWSFEEAPYFVESEYTAAGSLSEWLELKGNASGVPLATRLEIVAQVATALAAAHSVGVLHKDVKPANILICSVTDGEVKAQLADFGIGHLVERARLADAGITVMGFTEQAEETSGSSATGTRLYMAPELLEGRPATLQADIYALGVLLYQLVVGDFRRALGPGWRRDVEDDLLAEDIASFVDRSPSRRPASAQEVAQRLRNLEARRAERDAAKAARRELERSLRRRKLSTVIATVATGVLLMVSIFAAWAVNTTREEKEARLTAERVTDFLVELFEVTDPFKYSDPGATPGETMTARGILDRGAARLGSNFEGDPLIRAELMKTIGDIYRNLGLYDSAEPLIEEALALRREILGDKHLDVAESLNSLGELLYLKGDYDGAEPSYREALAIRSQVLGDEHAATAEVMNDLAVLLTFRGDYKDARPLLARALALRRQILGEEHLDVAESLNNTAILLHFEGKFHEAEKFYIKSIRIYRNILDSGHPHIARGLHNLAVSLYFKGDYEGAEPYYRESLEMRRRLLGNEHPFVARSLNGLALLLYTKGDYESAEPLFRESLDIKRRLFGDEHPEVATGMNNIGRLLHARGSYEAAEQILRESLEMSRQLLGDEHPNVARGLNNLASLLAARGDFAEAEELIRDALAVYRRALPPDHWRIYNAESVLAECFTALGRYEEAEPLLLRSHDVVRDRTGKRSIYTRNILERLVDLYENWDKPAKAAEYRAWWLEAGGTPQPELANPGAGIL